MGNHKKVSPFPEGPRSRRTALLKSAAVAASRGEQWRRDAVQLSMVWNDEESTARSVPTRPADSELFLGPIPEHVFAHLFAEEPRNT